MELSRGPTLARERDEREGCCALEMLRAPYTNRVATPGLLAFITNIRSRIQFGNQDFLNKGIGIPFHDLPSSSLPSLVSGGTCIRPRASSDMALNSTG